MALAAVALQDHMARSLSLQDPLKKKRINHSLPLSGRSGAKLGSNSERSRNTAKSTREFERKEYVLDPKPPPLSLGVCHISSNRCGKVHVLCVPAVV